MDRLKWRLIEFDCFNPKMNLALEEALLRSNLEEKLFNNLILWQNSKSVIVGFFNDIKSEVNIDACKSNNVEIVRRISGGGTVYHDLGNLNISLILNRSFLNVPTDVIKIYEWFSKPILNVLKRLGIKASFNLSNSIFINGKKVSGMAIHFLYDSLLIHCTLLLNADLKLMSKVLLNMKHNVMNLSSIIKKELSIQSLKRMIINEFENYIGVNFKTEKPTLQELNLAKELYVKKYNCDCWNFKKESINVEIIMDSHSNSLSPRLIKLINEAIIELNENISLSFKKINSNEFLNLLPALRVNKNFKPFKEINSKEELKEFIKNSY